LTTEQFHFISPFQGFKKGVAFFYKNVIHLGLGLSIQSGASESLQDFRQKLCVIINIWNGGFEWRIGVVKADPAQTVRYGPYSYNDMVRIVRSIRGV